MFRLASLAVLASSAVDLALSRAGGYAFRTDRLVLLALQTAGLATAVVATLAALVAARRALGRQGVPWIAVPAAAWAPIALFRVLRAPSPALAAAHLAILLALGMLALRDAGSAPKRGLLAALAVAAVALHAWALTPPPPGHAALAGPDGPPAGDRPSLVLVVLDTLRADHLGLYGYERPTSPALDRFAAGATVFERATSTSTYTLPSHATLFTGLYPRAHGADVDESSPLSLVSLGRLDDPVPVRPLADEATTLAELARDHGLATAAICANSAYLYRAFGLDQGFATYVDAPGTRLTARPAGLSLVLHALRPRSAWLRRRLAGNERYYLLAGEVNELALRWIDAHRDRPFFLFVNYMDPHQPLLPPPGYRDLFPGADAPQDFSFQGVRRGSPELATVIDAYDAEIRYLDDHLGELFEHLDRRGMGDRAAVIVVGDHGESLAEKSDGDRDLVGHAVSVYEGEARVPLIVRRPGQTAGRRVDRFVSIADVMPTALELLDIAPPPGLEGRSLLAAGARPVPSVVHLGRYMRAEEEQALYDDPWKLIRSSDRPPRLFDLRADPGELRDVAGDHPAVVERLLGELERFDQQVTPRFAGGAVELDAESRERLRSLGYTGE